MSQASLSPTVLHRTAQQEVRARQITDRGTGCEYDALQICLSNDPDASTDPSPLNLGDHRDQAPGKDDADVPVDVDGGAVATEQHVRRRQRGRARRLLTITATFSPHTTNDTSTSGKRTVICSPCWSGLCRFDSAVDERPPSSTSSPAGRFVSATVVVVMLLAATARRGGLFRCGPCAHRQYSNDVHRRAYVHWTYLGAYRASLEHASLVPASSLTVPSVPDVPNWPKYL